MKKFFTLCLAGTLCLAAASCDEDKEDNGGFSGKMTINGQTEAVKSAFYDEEPGNDSAEAQVRIVFLKDAYAEFPDMQPETRPDMMVLIGLSESLFGKTVDLTQPLDQHNEPTPALMYGGIHESHVITAANYLNNKILVSKNGTIKSGTLTMTRSGSHFTVQFSVTFSDGTSLAVDGKVKAKLSELPDM